MCLRERVTMEAGTHSIWISEQLQELGHAVIVANVRELRAISHSDRKSDRVDAEKLARYARLDPEILRPIAHRTVQQLKAFALIRARDLIIRLRTAAVNALRGLTKSCGYRMPASSTRCLPSAGCVMPPGLAQALGPVSNGSRTRTVAPPSDWKRKPATRAIHRQLIFMLRTAMFEWLAIQQLSLPKCLVWGATYKYQILGKTSATVHHINYESRRSFSCEEDL
jgi:transposase